MSSVSQKMEEMDLMVDDVHIIAAKMDEVLSRIRENCHGFISSAKEVANDVVKEAEKQTEEMKVELANWKEEKKRIAKTHTFEEKVNLDVGGHTCVTTLTTLTRFPDTLLGAMFSGRHALMKDESGAHFIDRDGTHFRYILNFLRSPETFDKSSIQGTTLTELKNEADHYGLKDLMFPSPPSTPSSILLGSPSTLPLVPTTTPTTLFGSAITSPLVPTTPLFTFAGTNNTPSSVVSATLPLIVRNHSGNEVTVSLGLDQLWRIQCNNIGVNPVVVQVCDLCGFGWPVAYQQSYGVQQFTTGRTISPSQPRKAGACPQCGK